MLTRLNALLTTSYETIRSFAAWAGLLSRLGFENGSRVKDEEKIENDFETKIPA